MVVILKEGVVGLFDIFLKKRLIQERHGQSAEDAKFEKQVRLDGHLHAGKRIASIINEKITSKELATQFILEELDSARKGDDFAKNFVLSSGFSPFEYEGAMNKTQWEGEESTLEHLQNFFRLFLVKFSDGDLMLKVSTTVLDEIMKIWKLGKYAGEDSNAPEEQSRGECGSDNTLLNTVVKTHNLKEGIFANINNDLNESISFFQHQPLILMAYAYARRTVAAGLFLQGVFNREHYSQASQVFRAIQLQTGHTVEFQEEAARQANELLSSYDLRIDKQIVSFITMLVELNQTSEQYTDGKHFIPYEVILENVLNAINGKR